MEFLKSKLLARKPSTKQVQPQHNHGPLDPRLFPVKKSGVAPSSNQYDWRQDTPFWNGGKSKPKVPAKPPKFREEPWTHMQGPASMWPGGQPGFAPMFLGRKTGVPGGGNAYFPSFNVANPKNPSNISRNIVMAPPPQRAPPAAGQYMAFAAAAAAAAAAAQHAAASTPVNKQLSENLKDRLEITELSDVEESQPVIIPAPDYRGARPSSERSRRSSSSASSAGQHGKILDIPSGLY